jgi:enoyl-[acyl-carrier-protein] reductase (NADH)
VGTLDGKVAFITSVMFLVSDQAKSITGVSLPIDVGFSVR